MIAMLMVLCNHSQEPTHLTMMVDALAQALGDALGGPYSPARLAVSTLSAEVSLAMIEAVRHASGISFFIATALVFVFYVLTRRSPWPAAFGALNVWVNLPLFDPTTGCDAVARLRRDAWLNELFGCLLIFLLPALGGYLPLAAPGMSYDAPLVVISTLAVWAFFPVSNITCGVAISRVSDLIKTERRHTHAQAKAVQTA